MKNQDKEIFKSLFREACQKCFGYPPDSPLSETDSKLLSNKIFDQTGLVIGAKSIKNYSFYVLNRIEFRSKQENPSVSTLDTLARYVLNAPRTDEGRRKDHESHYPYWFEYKRAYSDLHSLPKHSRLNLVKTALFAAAVLLCLFVVLAIIQSVARPEKKTFHDTFNSVLEDSLVYRGWIIKWKDTTYWKKRDEMRGHLALYTLRGDNWPLEDNQPMISNLLMREVNSDCFTAEINLTNFIPSQNWQQAGILLSEDSAFGGKMIRLSISYNDYFGGFEKPAEILIQALSSSESGSYSKPEEIAHYPVFTIEKDIKEIALKNLGKSAFKIEKRGTHFRFLYSTSEKESFAFREVFNGNFNIRPRYISIFSIQGWSENECIPAYFDSFSLDCLPCPR